MFSVPEESPVHHVRDLRVRIRGADRVPDKFFEYILWFTDVEVSLFGNGNDTSSLRTSLWMLPQSITSLAIDTSVFTLVQVWNIMAQLPNLDDLALSGFRTRVRERVLPKIRTPQRGRFRGRLLLPGYFGKDVMGMLLEIQPWLRFTEVEISYGRDLFLSTVRLVEACDKTLVKLS